MTKNISHFLTAGALGTALALGGSSIANRNTDTEVSRILDGCDPTVLPELKSASKDLQRGGGDPNFLMVLGCMIREQDLSNTYGGNFLQSPLTPDIVKFDAPLADIERAIRETDMTEFQRMKDQEALALYSRLQSYLEHTKSDVRIARAGGQAAKYSMSRAIVSIQSMNNILDAWTEEGIESALLVEKQSGIHALIQRK